MLIVSAAGGCGSGDGKAGGFHLRAYPMPGFRTESHDRLLFKNPPEGRWLDLPQGHLPVALARHDADVAIRIDGPSGATVRGEYGFAPATEETEPSTATFRIRLLSAEGTVLGSLLEERRSSEDAAFRQFAVSVPAGRTVPVYVGFDVRYESPRAERRRRAAVWVDPVIEQRVEPPRRPDADASSLLLITADTTRQDVLGPYGGEAATPSLDALAADGIVFENAFSVAFGTAPSHASLLTASPAAEHGVYDNQTILSPELLTLAEVLQGRGYETAAFVSAVPVARNLGFPQGFDLYDDLLGLDASSGLGDFAKYERRAEVTAGRFLAWLERGSRQEPFFVWLHFYDPHQPYAPPGPTATDPAGLYGYFVTPEGEPKHLRLPAKLRDNPRRLERVEAMARERYLAEVEHMDAQVGRVLDALKAKGLYDGMTVAFVADHGENLGEREHPLAFEHHGLFKDVTRLPLVLKLPGSKLAGRRPDFLLGNLDVAPTLLEIAGVEAPSQWSGRSFLRLLGEPQGREFRPYLVLEGANRQEISVRTRQWMYRRVLGEFRSQAEKLFFLGYASGRPQELYDLGADPGETVGLDPEGHPASGRLEEVLREFAVHETAHGERLETREHLEALKALGYLEP